MEKEENENKDRDHFADGQEIKKKNTKKRKREGCIK